MKMFLISDNIDTQMGLRLAGIEGVVVHDAASFEAAFKAVLSDEGVGIILLTSIVYNYDRERITQLKLENGRQLIVEISDRHKSHEVQHMIDETISKIVGEVV